MLLKSINPATEEVVKEVPVSTEKDVLGAVSKARKAFPAWKATPFSERAAVFQELAKHLEQRRSELAERITLEMGKPLNSAAEEVDEIVELIGWAVKNIEQYILDEKTEVEGAEAFVAFEPVGVLGVISPWNYPLSTPMWKFIPGLLVGNTVVSKISEYVPAFGIEFDRLFKEAGMPDGGFNVVTGDGVVGEMLVRSPVDQICFTGSVATGQKVASEAGKYLKRLVLELGGSDPFIVLEDADVKQAASQGVLGRFSNCGQICTAAKRFFIHENVYDEFKATFLEQVAKIKVGNPMDKQTTMGPMVSDNQRQILIAQVADAKEKGAAFLTGGNAIEGKGFFFEPTVLESVSKKMKVMAEETFGPVAPLDTFKTIEEAIAKANDTQYGLGGSVWSRDKAKATGLARSLDTGMVWVNDCGMPYPQCPWVGRKQSGIGHELSKYGIVDLMHTKPIIVK